MKNFQKIKREKKERRQKRVRAKVKGTSGCPRLCVFRSLKYTYAQIIDDQKGKTLVSAKTQEIKKKKNGKKIDLAFKVGELIGQKALKAGIKKVVFDRAGYKYHGRVKAIAEGVRKSGLNF